MVVLFQNPYNRETNEKWYDFKRYSTNFESSLGGEKYKKICHMKNTEIPSNRPRDTHLYYDIRLKK